LILIWHSLPYPCIGVFRFLDFPATLNPIYPEVLDRVRNGETFLDLGCCFGQDIRKLAFDGAPSENLIGVDTEANFLELGYELFRDRDTLKSHFYTQDVFAEGFLSEWHGKIDIIFLGSFLHLFSFDKQKAVVAQIEKLLKKRRGSLVFGRHMAAENGGSFRKNALGWDLYHHSPETIRQLFDEDPEGTWKVDSELVTYGSEGWDKGRNWQGNDVKQQNFWAKKL
jgi:SAM-dependent methyltransferase